MRVGSWKTAAARAGGARGSAWVQRRAREGDALTKNPCVLPPDAVAPWPSAPTLSSPWFEVRPGRGRCSFPSVVRLGSFCNWLRSEQRTFLRKGVGCGVGCPRTGVAPESRAGVTCRCCRARPRWNCGPPGGTPAGCARPAVPSACQCRPPPRSSRGDLSEDNMETENAAAAAAAAFTASSQLKEAVLGRAPPRALGPGDDCLLTRRRRGAAACGGAGVEPRFQPDAARCRRRGDGSAGAVTAKASVRAKRTS